MENVWNIHNECGYKKDGYKAGLILINRYTKQYIKIGNYGNKNFKKAKFPKGNEKYCDLGVHIRTAFREFEEETGFNPETIKLNKILGLKVIKFHDIDLFCIIILNDEYERISNLIIRNNPSSHEVSYIWNKKYLKYKPKKIK